MKQNVVKEDWQNISGRTFNLGKRARLLGLENNPYKNIHVQRFLDTLCISSQTFLILEWEKGWNSLDKGN